ncbi:protein containg PAS domain S-box [Longilinea arvoryzae]|uniref:Protein containg PAS domain S-box n=1 Tax=Longilinea arvoryzae TaxID=360412 RepID=A0A0K8MZD6_9CHLR|nr:HD domain-containing phosphohydrolase [Longilinea arvoryzae]GAP15997.1 protein containg PAS domain S-box [Longilinea arvoryzae]
MKLSFERRSLILIFLLLILIFAAVGLNAHRLLDDFRFLENHAVAQDTVRVEKAIHEELNRLSITVGDYAAWDDTCEYLETRNNAYIDVNYIPVSLDNLGINYLLILDRNGDVVKSIYHRSGDSKLTAIPEDTLSVILSHKAYLVAGDITSVRAGYVILPDGPVALAARAVVDSNLQGPIRGTMIMGRPLNEDHLAELSDDLLFNIHLVPAGLPESEAVLNNVVRTFAVTDLPENQIAGTVRIADLDNSENFVVGFTRLRTIYADGMQATTMFLAVFAVCGSMAAIIVCLLIQRLARAIRRQRSSDQYFSLLAKNSREIIVFTNYPGLTIIEANQAAVKTFGFSREHLMENHHINDLLELSLDLRDAETWQRLQQNGATFNTMLLRDDGSRLPVAVYVEAVQNEGNPIYTFLMRDISDRAERERVIEGLNQISNSLRTTISVQESVPILLEWVHQMFQADATALMLKDPRSERVYLYQATGDWIPDHGRTFAKMGIRLEDYFRDHKIVTTDVITAILDIQQIQPTFEVHEFGGVRILHENRLIGALLVGRKTPFSHSDDLLLESLADLTSNTMRRVSLFEQTREYARQIEAVEAIGRTLAETLDLNEIHLRLVESLLATFDGLESVSIWQRRLPTGKIEHVLGLRYDGFSLSPEDPGVVPPAILKGLETQEIQLIEEPLPAASDSFEAARRGSTLILPAQRNDTVMAVLEIHSLDGQCFTAERIDMMGLVASSAAIAYENALLYAEVEKRLSQLQSLREIDTAIVSTFNEGDVLNVLLEQFRKQLNVDAAVIWLPAANNHHLEVAQANGLPSENAITWGIDIDDSLRKKVKTFQAQPVVPGDVEAAWMEKCAYQCGYSAPLIAQGEPLGAVEVFNRQEIAPDTDWARMFETLARQGAVALSTLSMFKNLQRKNRDLVEAYNATIEGWARALDMRDHETRGHSLRVADMTVELARFMGVPEEEMEHIHRGALLHDIGKMGIPDSILLKPGSLDEQEWETMRLHPDLAGEFLKDIGFLHNAMDIPLYHHEWWNGEGYPRRLSGEEIPLAARIFAVIDVWDALSTDRIYRVAWPRDAVLPYILSQSGTHFDPRVVEMFMLYMQQYDEAA